MKRMITMMIAAVFALTMLAGCGNTTGSVTTDGSTSMEKVIGALGEAFQNDTGISFTYNPTGSVSTDGSTSMEKVIGALGEAFQNDTGISFTYNPTGSGSGIKAVQEGR